MSKSSSTMRVRMGRDLGRLKFDQVIDLPTKAALALLSHRCCNPVTVSVELCKTDIILDTEDFEAYQIPPVFLRKAKTK
jgi:hypothetical protein